MVTAFRFGGVTQPTDSGSTLAYNPKLGMYIPTSVKSKEGSFKASAGPFSFKAEVSKESSFTWTPLSAKLDVGAAFALKLSTELSTNTAGVDVTWKPALPGSEASLAFGAAAALVAVPAILMGLVAQAGSEQATKNVMSITAYLGLVSAALGLIAVQKNMTLKLVMPPTLDITLHPLLVVKKEEGKEASFSALDSKTALYEWSNNTGKTGAALGIVSSSGTQSSSNVGDVGANGGQARSSVVRNTT